MDRGAGTAANPGVGASRDAGARVGDAGARDAAAAQGEAAAVCNNELGKSLARVSCDGFRVLVAAPIVAPPGHPLPPRATRRMLDAVAALLRGHPELQLLRIEAYSSHDPGPGPARARREIHASQARADAVFRYLWRHDKIQPERLDAVGYGFRPAFKGAAQRWPIVLRVVQRAR